MANHFHAVLHDEYANRSEFAQHFNSVVARATNKYRNRRGHFWSNQKVSDPSLLDTQAVIDKVVYSALNPVQAGLVEKASDWPVTILPDDWGKTIRVYRPDTYFRDTPEHPEYIEFTPLPPVEFRDRPLHQTIKFFNREIRKAERKIAKQRRREGKTFKGIEAVYDESPNTKIKTSKTKNCRPQFFASSATVYAKAKVALRKFRSDLRDAVRKFKEDPSTIFPAGTIMMRRRFGVRCCEIEFDDPYRPNYYAPKLLAA